MIKAVGYTLPDSFYGTLESSKVTTGFKLNYGPASGTAIAPQPDSLSYLVEIGLDKSMPPNSAIPTTGTPLRSFPGKFFP